MADALIRQWTLLQRIPRYPKSITLHQLIAALEQDGVVDVPTYRTIQRDLDLLSTLFPWLQCEKRDAAHYWYVAADQAVLEIPRMEPATALAFHLAEQQLKPQLPPSALQHLQPHFNTAGKVLDSQDDDLAHWRNKIRVLPQTQLLIPQDIIADVLDVVYTALLEDRRFNGQYFGRRDDHFKTFDVNPLGLVFRGTVTYLVATLNEYTDVRILALHRFIDAELNEQARWVPDGFDLDAYIAEGHVDFLMGVTINMELLIDEEVAIHLRESKLSSKQQLIPQADGKTLFKAEVKDTGQLRWWLLGFADQVEVLKPDSLREEFKVKTARMAEKYHD